jgi:FdhD protein
VKPDSRRDVTREVVAVRGGRREVRPDHLAAEEPLEIRLLWQEAGGTRRKNLAVTMRTPGSDFELTAGFLFGEGLIRGIDDVADIAYCTDEGEEQNLNIVQVTLRPGLEFDPARLERNFYTTSSCGVCGKAALEALEVEGCAVVTATWSVAPEVIQRLPAKLRAAQKVFERTGGLHACGLFDRAGDLVDLREDVGRHNAMDKLVGARLIAGETGFAESILMLSGRASFELLQKALVAGIPLVAAVGAPSSLAVDLAGEFGITLLGFTRADGFNIYTGPEMIR